MNKYRNKVNFYFYVGIVLIVLHLFILILLPSQIRMVWVEWCFVLSGVMGFGFLIISMVLYLCKIKKNRRQGASAMNKNGGENQRA